MPAQEREQASSTEHETAPVPARLTALDVEQEIRSVLGEVAAASGSQPVRLEIAVQSELMLYGDRAAFHHALAALLRQVSSLALVGRVLVTASRSGEWVQVNVTDDGTGAERRAREAALQPIERLIARQGGTLEVASFPEGATVLTRWPVTGPATAGQGRLPLDVGERISTG
jgi:signal transduction histidine kinase